MQANMTQSTDIPVTEAMLVKKALKGSMDYAAYREEVRKQVMEGRTSGLNQSESYVYYTLLNHKRMNRWEKRTKLPAELQRSLAEERDPLMMLVLTESWCGDAAPVLPVLNAFADASDSLELRIALRDEHPLLMDRFLTNQARSIPKLLVVRPETYEVIGSWGPRPSEAMQMATAYKESHGKLTDEFRQTLQIWYNEDRGRSIVKEVSSLLGLE
jgi:hypothetical protein